MLVSLDYYFDVYGGNILQNDDTALKLLKKAEKQVDIITYHKILNGKIAERGEPLLSIVKDIICEQAEFISNNEDLTESTYKKYSINGVTVETTPSNTLIQIEGIYIKRSLYNELVSYGLCYRGF